MHEFIVSSIISIVTSTISAFVTFIFTKKKYQAETGAIEVANMKESLEFYQTLSEDNKRRLIALLEENEKQRESIEKQREEISRQREEISELKAQIAELASLVRESTKNLDANADQIP